MNFPVEKFDSKINRIEDTMDIVVPTYELMNSVIDSMHSVTLDIHTARGDIHIPWTEKKNTAIFRGRDSNKVIVFCFFFTVLQNTFFQYYYKI